VAAKSSKKAIAARNRPPVELQVPERDQPRNAE
jgi:hypothetical protein